MSDIVIKAENLTKIYKIYEKNIDRLKETFHPFHKRYSRDFFALNDVSFEIGRGENVGLIGKNGAGKSTLLKIITGVLTPSSGKIEVHGRIASLLELGAGFNPEMTGVENIFMNGLLMGQTRETMNEKLDEIISFADIGEFVHQPVKTYSSGMFARLAFAVNAFVEPDILIIDEALSVGDAFFQSKCMDKMRTMIDSGVTVLFVSHDTFAVKNLCSRAFLIQGGKKIMDAPSKEVVEVYRNMLLQSNKEISTNEQLEEFIAQFKQSKTEDDSDKKNNPPITAENLERNKELFLKNAAYNRVGDGRATFENIQLLDLNGEPISEIIFGQEVFLRMVIKLHENISFLGMGYHIRNSTGVDLIYTDSRFDGMKAIIDGKRGEIFIVDWKFKVELRQELYDIACVISTPNDETFSDVNVCDFVPCALQFSAIHQNNKMILTGGYVHWHNDLKISKLN
ncbi:MAG: ABC transporter ATP-binding protein [Selenomonadaceae bacterium]|nr:ABC transporter ATP-binding protein [Selenomonadaceae bacterium]